MSKPLYSPGPIQPAVDLYDPVVLIGATGVLTGANGEVKQVVGIEPIPSLGSHGVLLIWTASGAAPAGYELYGGEGQGAIAIGGSTAGSPTALQLAADELLHFRMNFRIIGTLPTGLAAGDLDFQVAQPASSLRWSLPGVVGGWNQAIQTPLPADPAISPSQGSDQAVASAYPDTDAFSPLSEIICTYQNSPRFQILNHGSVAIPATAAMAIGIVAQGFRYDLQTLHPGPGWMPRVLGGRSFTVPPMVKFLPVAGFAPSGIQ